MTFANLPASLGTNKHQSLSAHTRAINLIGAALLASSVGSACAQGDDLQIVSRSSQVQHSVSVNQLSTPRKAQKAVERARQDLLHGHAESAQKELACALKLAPHYSTALAIQGAMSLQAGNAEDAARAFQDAIDADPAFGAAYVGMGEVLIVQHRPTEALIPLARADALLPGSWYVHWQIALAYMRQGNTQAALKEIDVADQFAGSDPQRKSGDSYLRAMVFAGAADSDRAREYLAETIARDPRGNYAILAKKEVERLHGATDPK